MRDLRGEGLIEEKESKYGGAKTHSRKATTPLIQVYTPKVKGMSRRDEPLNARAAHLSRDWPVIGLNGFSNEMS